MTFERYVFRKHILLVFNVENIEVVIMANVVLMQAIFQIPRLTGIYVDYIASRIST